MNAQSQNRIMQMTLLLLGSAMLAFGLYNIHGQSAITEGGLLGLTLLLHHHFGISYALSGLIFDLSCYVLGFFVLGRHFARFAVIASLCYAGCMALFSAFPPVLPPLPPLVAAVLGGVFVGVGVGGVVRIGGACGGDDAVALVFSKWLRCNIAWVYFVLDGVVLLLSLTYLEPMRIVYSLLSVTISSSLISLIARRTQRA